MLDVDPLYMIAPGRDGPGGPMMIAGSPWHRWRRGHPSRNLADFRRSVIFYNLGVCQKCMVVSSDTLLRGTLRAKLNA